MNESTAKFSLRSATILLQHLEIFAKLEALLNGNRHLQMHNEWTSSTAQVKLLWCWQHRYHFRRGWLDIMEKLARSEESCDYSAKTRFSTLCSSYALRGCWFFGVDIMPKGMFCIEKWLLGSMLSQLLRGAMAVLSARASLVVISISASMLDRPQ